MTDKELQKLAKLIVEKSRPLGKRHDPRLEEYLRFRDSALCFWDNLVRNLKGDPLVPEITDVQWRWMILDTAEKAAKLKT